LMDKPTGKLVHSHGLSVMTKRVALRITFLIHR
jgi:hypothetical protein